MAADKYANIATITVTESSADTLTFAELRTNVGIEPDRKSASAIIIDEIDYFVSRTTLLALNADGDGLRFAITLSNAVTDLEDFSDRRILHSGVLVRLDGGTAGNFVLQQTPLIYQFFPPLVTAERSLFLGVQGQATAVTNVLRCRIYHRVVEITQAEFIELAEVFRLVG